MHFNPIVAFAILAYAGNVFSAPHSRLQCGKSNGSPMVPEEATMSSGSSSAMSQPMETPVMDPNHPLPPMPSSPSGLSMVRTPKAIYFITNSDTNYIVSIHVAPNGHLMGPPFLTPTGGSGLSGMDANGIAAPDSLFSQDSLTVVDNYLFAVNAGSSTLSMFEIDPEKPCKLTPVGTPQKTGGEFPQSVAFSSKISTACVNNGGAIDGVTCFKVDPKTGLNALDASPRSFGLGQTTPPVGPTQTASDIQFNEDSSALLVTVKGNPTTNFTGFLASYPVIDGAVSQEAVKSSPDGTAVLFGFSKLSQNTIISTDASFGAAILSLDSELSATTLSRIEVPNQTAVCWSSFSPASGSAYVTDVALNRIAEINTETGKLVQIFNLTNGNAGNIDIAVGGDFVYALSPSTDATHVAVLDISGGMGNIVEVQNYGIVGLPNMGAAMGMQTFPMDSATMTSKGDRK